jgi:hypothetical protein
MIFVQSKIAAVQILKQMKKILILMAFLGGIGTFELEAQTATVKGIINDTRLNETVVGANVRIEGTTLGTVSDIDGSFELKNVPAGPQILIVSFITYSTEKIEIEVPQSGSISVEVNMIEDISELALVTVSAVRETASDISLLRDIKESIQVVSGISAESIKKTLDSDASQVVKRIPGVTVVQDRFIVIRGLNERYNTTQLHNINTPKYGT